MDAVKNYASAALAIAIALGVIILIALGHMVPGELWVAFSAVIGFFFGTGTTTTPPAAK